MNLQLLSQLRAAAEAKDAENAVLRRELDAERERRKDRQRGGQPGHQGKGLERDPEPDENKDAEPPAQCRIEGGDYSDIYALACMSLTAAASVNSSMSFASGRIDYKRPIDG